jgi:hypothetical protein
MSWRLSTSEHQSRGVRATQPDRPIFFWQTKPHHHGTWFAIAGVTHHQGWKFTWANSKIVSTSLNRR